MDFASFFKDADSARAARVFSELTRHDVSGWALTGGVAIELQILRHGGKPMMRPLHDLDFITWAFQSIPESLGSRLLARHVHPHGPPGKMLLQAVEAKTQVRLDVFRAFGLEMERVARSEAGPVAFRVVSLPDLAARHARLNWDLIEGRPVAPKYARDFLRLVELVGDEDVEPVWQEHRPGAARESFAETVGQLRRVIGLRPDRLVALTYSTDVDAVCPRCEATGAFTLADPRQILALLGYC